MVNKTYIKVYIPAIETVVTSTKKLELGLLGSLYLPGFIDNIWYTDKKVRTISIIITSTTNMNTHFKLPGRFKHLEHVSVHIAYVSAQ